MRQIIALLNKLWSRCFDTIEGITVYSTSTPGWVLENYIDTKIVTRAHVLNYKSGRKIAYVTIVKYHDLGDITTLTNASIVEICFETQQEFQAFCKENGLRLLSIDKVLVPRKN